MIQELLDDILRKCSQNAQSAIWSVVFHSFDQMMFEMLPNDFIRKSLDEH